MFDTYITIVGNVLTRPEWRRTSNTGALVANFKIASTARRYNKNTGQWIDGNSLRVRVNCWRALASNVASSVTVGDPLIVAGRLYTRDWVDESGTHRTLYELEAMAVGHDLTRGRARFERVKAATTTSTVEDEEAARRVGGQLAEQVPEDEAPARFDPTPYDDFDGEPIEAPIEPIGYDLATTPAGDSLADPDDAADAPIDAVGRGGDLSPVPA